MTYVFYYCLVVLVCIQLKYVLGKRNFVVIVTDDQDAWSDPDFTHQPKLRKYLLNDNKGMQIRNAFANSPICCASRQTMLTGRYPHSKGMGLSNRDNCGTKDFRTNAENDSVAVHFKNAGYNTAFFGKYLNTYGTTPENPSYIPPGWNRWFALVGNSKYWNYTIVTNDNVITTELKFGSNSNANEYLPNVLADKSIRFIESNYKLLTSPPFLLWISLPTPHAPFHPFKAHVGSKALEMLPKTEAFDFYSSDKHQPISDLKKPLTFVQTQQIEDIYRKRLEGLQSVDDLIQGIVGSLQEGGLLNETYIVYTSDHGFHLGQFRLPFDKRQPYDFDIRVPFVISGPQIAVSKKKENNLFITHVDLAPTLLELGGVKTTSKNFDGTSYAKHIISKEKSSLEEESSIRTLALIEYEGEGGETFPLNCGSEKVRYDDFLRARTNGFYIPAVCDHKNNSFSCLRGSQKSFVGHAFLYCEFDCFAVVNKVKTKVHCGEEHDQVVEFYNIEQDPHQLENLFEKKMSTDLKKHLSKVLNEYKKCKGWEDCERIEKKSQLLKPLLFLLAEEA